MTWNVLQRKCWRHTFIENYCNSAKIIKTISTSQRNDCANVSQQLKVNARCVLEKWIEFTGFKLMKLISVKMIFFNRRKLSRIYVAQRFHSFKSKFLLKKNLTWLKFSVNTEEIIFSPMSNVLKIDLYDCWTAWSLIVLGLIIIETLFVLCVKREPSILWIH